MELWGLFNGISSDVCGLSNLSKGRAILKSRYILTSCLEHFLLSLLKKKPLQLFLEELQIYCRELPYTFHPASLNVNASRDHSLLIKTKKLMLVQYY